MITYVATYTCGCYDDKYYGNLYVGIDYDKAKKSITEFEFPDDCNRFGNIELWENEKLIKNHEIQIY